LINNAGVVSLDPVKRDALREALAVNLVGPVSVTEAFLSLLRNSPSPRIIFVSSSVGSLTHSSDPTSHFYNPAGMEYRASKSGLSMVIIQYQHMLKDEGFKVFGADPGLVATNLTKDPDSLRKMGASDADVGGARVASVVRGDRDADVGRVCGEYGVLPW
jgi:NAD(P)-dependent dehydrogenase (short-subunit alcohol dehydrogenase family)